MTGSAALRAQDLLVLALDKMGVDQTRAMCRKTRDAALGVKVHSVWDRLGMEVVPMLKEDGAGKVWVDLKINDTVDTVAERAAVVKESGADILTVHASGGIEMMISAIRNGPPTILFVTLLSSLSDAEAAAIYGNTPEAKVLHLAQMAAIAAQEGGGSHGIVCSPKQVGQLAKRRELKVLRKAVPGTRSPGKDAHDQKQIDTPANTYKAGADWLVIGRQATKAEDPVAALQQIVDEIVAGQNG